MHTSPITPYKDYKIWLQSELMRRCHDNPKYSLRAFSASLKLSPSFLSKVLSGKRSLTLKTANKILPSLDLSPQEKESFLHLVFEDRQTSTSSPKQGQVEDYTLLTMDAFSIISDWYHYAITELTSLEDFENDPRWISKKLGISVIETKMALQRLKRLRILNEKNGELIKSSESLTTTTDISSTALKKFHQQPLEMALRSLREDDVLERDFTSMTMAINENKLPFAKKRIKNFRRALCKQLSKGKKTRVYNLCIQLYPLSKNNPGRKQ